MRQTRKQTYEKAIELWGADNQVNQAIEELQELGIALNKFRRNSSYAECRDSYNSYRGNVLEEIADVRQMIGQLILIFDFKDPELQEMSDIVLRKLQREIDHEREKRRG
jgi:hypothetical protein